MKRTHPTDKSQVEESVRNFYEQGGWDSNSGGHTLDSQLWEDLRPSSHGYIVACRRKVLKYLPKSGDLLLDAASGPIQYPEYLEYSSDFKKRVCVDISQKALDEAQKKLGEKGEVYCGSLLELPYPDNHFDAGVSLHTIYHIDKADQERAVRELIRVMKPGAPLVIVYSNPDKLLSRLKRKVKETLKLFGKNFQEGKSEKPIYFFAHPLSWWQQFSDQTGVESKPWRTLTAQDAQRFIPSGSIGTIFLRIILAFENKFPDTSLNFGAYPMFILKKRK